MMTFNEVASKLNLMDPYFLTGKVMLNSAHDSGSFDIMQQGKTTFIYGIDVSAIDADGKDILKDIGALKDIITVNIHDEMSNHYMNIPMPLSALASSNGAYRFPGFVLQEGVRYHVELSAAPADGGTTGKGSYPLTIHIAFLANKPMTDIQYKMYLQSLNNTAQ